MAIPAAKTLVKIDDTRGSELTVKVTGYQWKWQYEYVDQGVSFFSTLARTSDEARQLDSGIAPQSVDNYLLEVDNPLVVPQGKKVRVLITANDVIHAWWCRNFGIKKDAIPATSTRCGSARTSPVSTAASVRNCAAATTASCGGRRGEDAGRVRGLARGQQAARQAAATPAAQTAALAPTVDQWRPSGSPTRSKQTDEHDAHAGHATATPPSTTTTTARPRASSAGSPPRTTRTSARCTSCSAC